MKTCDRDVSPGSKQKTREATWIICSDLSAIFKGNTNMASSRLRVFSMNQILNWDMYSCPLRNIFPSRHCVTLLTMLLLWGEWYKTQQYKHALHGLTNLEISWWSTLSSSCWTLLKSQRRNYQMKSIISDPPHKFVINEGEIYNRISISL